MIASGQEQWRNRGQWALSYLTRVEAVERSSRGHYQITDVGRQLLVDFPGDITERNLRSLPHYESRRRTRRNTSTPAAPQETVDEFVETVLDLEEQISAGVTRIHADVADQLLKRILRQDSIFFEQAVLDLLMAMGYGGAEGTATRTQLARDGGIDGIIDQDALGLSRIYVQAKRNANGNVIGRPDIIQAFVGALAGNQAHQGVFITTSRFSSDARAYVDQIPSRVVLIDGERLTRLMIRYGVGVQAKHTVHIVEVDEDFFE